MTIMAIKKLMQSMYLIGYQERRNSMAALWEIDAQIEELMDKLIDEETGEVNEEAMEELDKLNIDRKTKLENCGIMMKELTNEITALKDEINALKTRARVKTNKLESLSEYVKKSLNGEKFETSKVAYGYRRAQRVDIVNEDIVPDSWCRFETKRSVMKDVVKKALKNGEVVPGCTLTEVTHLMVK